MAYILYIQNITTNQDNVTEDIISHITKHRGPHSNADKITGLKKANKLSSNLLTTVLKSLTIILHYKMYTL